MSLVTITPDQVQKALEDISTTGSKKKIKIEGLKVTPSPNEVTTNDLATDDLINLNAFRNNPHFANIDGSGFSTVIIDTGIDLDHPFFGADADSNGIADRIVYQYDFADNDKNATDKNGHGSNVTTIAASSDATYRGMAPNSNIIALKVFKNDGTGDFKYIEKALQWVITNAATYNIASVNMSLGDGGNYTTAQQEQETYGISDEIQALTDLGIIIVSAAGNNFTRFGVQGVSYPAADPNSLSVGAVYTTDIGPVVYKNGARSDVTGADIIAPFSQRHPVVNDIFAPGAPITGANQSGGTVTVSGTSQASPHIAGIVTLMQELAVEKLGRRLTFTEFGNLLKSTGVTINDGDDEIDNANNTGLNFKRVDVLALGQAILALAPPEISINYALNNSLTSLIEGNNGVTNITFTVNRSGDISTASSVEYLFTGDATYGNDYTVTSITGDNLQVTNNTINFAPGATSATINVDIFGDLVDETDEKIIVSLLNPLSSGQATISGSPFVTTIIDDDISSQISINDVIILEGNSGSKKVSFTVSLSTPSPSPITVNYATADQTGIAGSDYISNSGTITFAPGEISQTINIPIIGDKNWEDNETFLVNLSNPTNASINKAVGIATIKNNDLAPTSNYSITAGVSTLQEGASGTNTPITFTIDRTGFTSGSSHIKYNLSGSATNNLDYKLVGVTGDGITNSGQIVKFGVNATQATLTFNVIDDPLKEVDENIIALISSPRPSNGTISNSSSHINIQDNDPTPSISFKDIKFFEGNNGITKAKFNLILSNANSETINVDYTTVDVTATAGTDYVGAHGTLTFLPKQKKQTLTIDVIGDTQFEPEKTFALNFSNAVNLMMSDFQAIATITNDDHNLVGTNSVDLLTGTKVDETLSGLGEADTLTGGLGKDQFIYQYISDGGDTINDFKVNKDKIVFSNLLSSLSYTGADPFADGIIQFTQQGKDTSISIDSDGLTGGSLPQSFILVKGVSISSLRNPNNFIL